MPRIFLEQPTEMLRILKPQIISYLSDLFPIDEFVFSHFNDATVNMVPGGYPGFFLYQIPEIAG